MTRLRFVIIKIDGSKVIRKELKQRGIKGKFFKTGMMEYDDEMEVIKVPIYDGSDKVILIVHLYRQRKEYFTVKGVD